MYKVFVNEKLICFTNNTELVKEFSNVLVVNFYHHDVIPSLIELVEKDDVIDAIIINVIDIEKDFNDFKTYFKNIEAAGGIVFNTEKDLLFIHRLGKWDLPKGKLEKNETKEQGAVREVMEECGIDNLDIIKELPRTYHIYKHKDKLVLKTTHWFEMNTSFSGVLIPQTEEGIIEVEWLDKGNVKEKVMPNTYHSIKELLVISYPGLFG